MVLKGRVGSSAHGRAQARPRSSGAAGFTLLEVLIAMIILAFGLLALQSLSMVAVRAAALAEQNTRTAAIASRFLEEALDQLRQAKVPASFDCTLGNGDQVIRSVAAGSGSRLALVTVEVTPEPRGLPAQPYMIHAHAYSPQGFHLAAPAFVCP